MRRPIVALNIPRKKNEISHYAQFIHDSMKKSVCFPAPPTADDRNAKLAKVKADLEALRTYVQRVAEFSPGNAAEIVLGAGISLKKPGPFDKPLRVKRGPSEGTVVLIAKAAGAHGSYEWQHSPDGRTWTDLPPTRQAKTTVGELAARSLWYFRYRSLGKEGRSDWSDAVSFLVM